MHTTFVLVSALFIGGLVTFGYSQLPVSTNQPAASAVELSTLSPNLVTPQDLSIPLRVSGGIIAGQVLKKALPIFPPKTNCLYVSGAVVMRAIIGKDGHMKSVNVISGADVMRQPTVVAVKQWEYRPFQLHGVSIEVETTITTIVEFNNDGC